MSTLREIRLSQDISQAVLAEKAGVSIPAIVRMETGKPAQKLKLEMVCKALGVRLEDIEGVQIYSAVQSAAKRDARKHAK